MTKVYFATNRYPDAAAVGGFGFAPSVVPVYAVADVAGIDLANADAGSIASISGHRCDSFSADVLTEIAADGKPVVVFIHGFDNSFEAAMVRAAYLAEMYRTHGADVTMLAFTWPSAGELLDGNINPTDAYFSDQKRADGSAQAIADFFQVVAGLRSLLSATNPNATVTLLCHSMGNRALGGALDVVAKTGKPELLFDAAVLAAADEQANSFELPDGSRLGRLPHLAARITVYHASCDAALRLSSLAIVNGVDRLGLYGPAGAPDPVKFPGDIFRIVDCSAVDRDPLFDPGSSHQYYRWQADVEADTAAVILGKVLGPVLSIARPDSAAA